MSIKNWKLAERKEISHAGAKRLRIKVQVQTHGAEPSKGDLQAILFQVVAPLSVVGLDNVWIGFYPAQASLDGAAFAIADLYQGSRLEVTKLEPAMMTHLVDDEVQFLRELDWSVPV